MRGEWREVPKQVVVTGGELERWWMGFHMTWPTSFGGLLSCWGDPGWTAWWPEVIRVGTYVPMYLCTLDCIG